MTLIIPPEIRPDEPNGAIPPILALAAALSLTITAAVAIHYMAPIFF